MIQFPPAMQPRRAVLRVFMEESGDRRDVHHPRWRDRGQFGTVEEWSSGGPAPEQSIRPLLAARAWLHRSETEPRSRRLPGDVRRQHCSARCSRAATAILAPLATGAGKSPRLALPVRKKARFPSRPPWAKQQCFHNGGKKECEVDPRRRTELIVECRADRGGV